MLLYSGCHPHGPSEISVSGVVNAANKNLKPSYLQCRSFKVTVREGRVVQKGTITTALGTPNIM